MATSIHPSLVSLILYRIPSFKSSFTCIYKLSLSLVLTPASYRYIINVFPEAICCCLQTCYVAIDGLYVLIISVSYIIL